jgi:hypothetical protein
MKMKKTVLASLVLVWSSGLFADSTLVQYPKGYKEWKHIKTMIIKPEHPMAEVFQGIHHIYANEKAYSGYKTGVFADGSMIALDYLKYKDVNHTIIESDRNYVAIMSKNESKYTKTGGWGYEAFAGNTKDKRLTADGGVSCFECHKPQQKNSYIFSKIRE